MIYSRSQVFLAYILAPHLISLRAFLEDLSEHIGFLIYVFVTVTSRFNALCMGIKSLAGQVNKRELCLANVIIPGVYNNYKTLKPPFQVTTNAFRIRYPELPGKITFDRRALR